MTIRLREASAKRRAAAEEARHVAVIQKVETLAFNLASRGERLTRRNASREGLSRFTPGSVESVVLTMLQRALGGRCGKDAAVAARLGPRYLQRISEAAVKLRQQGGPTQMPLPLGHD